VHDILRIVGVSQMNSDEKPARATIDGTSEVPRLEELSSGKVPIYREAQRRLRDYIRDHRLTTGERLPSEATLAEELGVSKPSLREATRSLQTLGVIEAQHGNGLFVGSFSLRPVIEQLPYGLAHPGTSLNEVLVAREAMEVGLMPAVCQTASDTDLDSCDELYSRMAEFEVVGKSTTDTDRQFHLCLYRSLDNPLVDNLIEIFWELFTRLGDAIPAQSNRNASPLIHHRIVEALRARDVQLSIQRMQEHFNDVRTRVATLADSGR
jgi:DNA-binding FadR family transcriptional regulator